MNLELNNKIVLITGGSQGIGKATALSMVKEDAKTIICARDINELKNSWNFIFEIDNSSFRVPRINTRKIMHFYNFVYNILIVTFVK